MLSPTEPSFAAPIPTPIEAWHPKRIYDVQPGPGERLGWNLEVLHSASLQKIPYVTRVEFAEDADSGLARVTALVRMTDSLQLYADELTHAVPKVTFFQTVTLRQLTTRLRFVEPEEVAEPSAIVPTATDSR